MMIVVLAALGVGNVIVIIIGVRWIWQIADGTITIPPPVARPVRAVAHHGRRLSAASFFWALAL